MYNQAELRDMVLRYGSKILSSAEAISFISGCNVRDGYRILRSCDHDLRELLHLSYQEIEKIGVKQDYALKLEAALELAKRAKLSRRKYPSAKSPAEVADYLMPEMVDHKKEYFKVLLLDSELKIVKDIDVSIGTVNASLVHPREVFSQAIKYNAVSIILAHNHPSGNILPSDEDKKITQRLKESGEIIGISVVDHVIIGDCDYFSFQEMGIL